MHLNASTLRKCYCISIPPIDPQEGLTSIYDELSSLPGGTDPDERQSEHKSTCPSNGSLDSGARSSYSFV